MKYKIKDWAGNDLSKFYGEFKTFSDACDKLISMFNDEEMDDYYVEAIYEV